MQRGIDSFFKRVPKKEASDEVVDSSPAPKKRKARVISSDEDEIAESPQVKSSRSSHSSSHDSKKARKAQDSKSPANGTGKTSKKPSLSKLKEATKKELKAVDPNILFGGETTRVEAKKAKARYVLEMEDDAIDQSLMEVDLDQSITAQASNPIIEITDSLSPPASNRIKHDTAKASNTPSTKTTPKGRKSKAEKNGTPRANKEHPSNPDTKSPSKDKRDSLSPPATKRAKQSSSPQGTKSTPKASKPKAEKTRTPRATKDEHSDLDTSHVVTDEDRHERKRIAAVLYQQYKNRSSCLNHGCKEIPKGKPDCLKGMTFLVTGILESMERGEADALIKECGGKVMTVVGKKLNYLVVGEEAGPKKLALADEHNVTILSEDGLLDLIRERSGENGHGTPEDSKSHNIKKERKSEQTSSKKEPQVTPKKQNESPEKLVKVEPKKEAKPSPKETPKTQHKLTPKTLPKRSPTESINNNDYGLNKTASETAADQGLNIAWVDKYKPTTIKDIVGQAGAASNVNKLTNWLTKWYINHDGKKKLQRPNPWAKNDDGSFYKAALLSGPPGIGKTTTSTLVCKELGFDTVEFNASDTRSKRLLKEEVASLLGNKSLYGYANGQSHAVTKKHVLLMDEVDGMAGNEDRGGMQELIALIKESSVPIICMCNDRNHPKIRSLVNYCYDLRFQRPRLEQIKGRMMMICCREKIKLTAAKVEEIISATNNDIRQSINHLALLSAGEQLQLPMQNTKDEKIAQKDLKLGPWDVVRKVFSPEEHKHMTLNDKSDLFFHDYSLAPLFVQQNYLQVSPQGPRDKVMEKVAATADALSLGDLVDKRIRSQSAWSLLPTQAMLSSVLPGEYMCGHFTGQINFPGWLGKNSRTNKRSRLAQELHDHTRVCTSGSRLSMRLDYAQFLISSIVSPLVKDGQEGVPSALQVMKDYHLLREDLESLIELTSWPGKKSAMDRVDGRVKAALTRAYNKEVMPYSYSAQAGIKKKRAEATADDDEQGLLGLEGEENDGTAAVSDEEEDNDNLDLDCLIKAKKKSAAASTSKAAASAGSKKAAAGGKSKAKPKK